MDRRLAALLALIASGGLGGCAHRTVRLEVAPAPAVSLPSSTVAVVAQDRECRPIADAIIDELGSKASIAVDPRAQTRLLVFGCGLDIGWTLRQEVDATGDRTRSIDRSDLTGRGHAVVAITTPEGTLAHLVGSSRDGVFGAWGVSDMFRSQRTMRRSLVDGLALDLVDQLNPLPQQLARRVYPNAVEGSPRELHNLAVLAEQRGDLPEAVRLARAALDERPTERSARYLRELERRAGPLRPAPPSH